MSPTADAVLGIDLGTSVVKAGIYGFDGTTQATASHPVALHRSPQGCTEQDLDEFYRAAAAATRQCLRHAGIAPGRIGAMAVAGQMAGVGIVDAEHRPMAPYDSWLDSRCSEIVDELSNTVRRQITTVAGCPPTISIGPKMAWWRRHEPRLCDTAAAFVTAAGYVTGRAGGLSGREAFIDPSYLHFTSVADVERGQWDDDLVAAVGVDRTLLPRIVESTSIVAELTAQAGIDFGLPAGVPVAAGCGDTAASVLGSGVTEAGQAFDIAGTAAVFGLCLPLYAPDTENSTLMTMRSPLPGRWYSLAYVAGAGQVIEWICREVLGHAELGEAAYANLADAAATVAAGSDGVVLSPHFGGRIAPVAPSMRGSVIGLSPTHGRSHLARATLESIAFEYRRYAEIVRRSAPAWPGHEVIGTGGGSRLGVWNQIKADVLATPYRPVVGVETGTRGAALVAMAALGHDCPELDAAAWRPVVEPDPLNQATYDAAYARYRRWSDLLDEGYRTEAAHPHDLRTGERT